MVFGAFSCLIALFSFCLDRWIRPLLRSPSSMNLWNEGFDLLDDRACRGQRNFRACGIWSRIYVAGRCLAPPQNGPALRRVARADSPTSDCRDAQPPCPHYLRRTFRQPLAGRRSTDKRNSDVDFIHCLQRIIIQELSRQSGGNNETLRASFCHFICIIPKADVEGLRSRWCGRDPNLYPEVCERGPGNIRAARRPVPSRRKSALFHPQNVWPKAQQTSATRLNIGHQLNEAKYDS